MQNLHDDFLSCNSRKTALFILCSCICQDVFQYSEMARIFNKNVSNSYYTHLQKSFTPIMWFTNINKLF